MERYESLHRLLAEGGARGAYPAAAAALGVGREIRWMETWGDCRITTLFDMASVSKILSATIIALKFWEQGRLSLEDRVRDFFPDAPEDKADITIAHLMTHTGGISPFFFLSRAASTPHEAVQAILERPLVGEVGSAPRYSCMGYILLGKILEQLGGKPLDQLARELVFDPLGMKDTTYRPQGDIAPTEADPATGIPLRGIVHDENARFLGGISGNAGVFSHILDMARFAGMLSCRGEPILKPQTLAAALENRTPRFEEHRGLGFQLAAPGNYLEALGPHSFGHTGFTGTSIAVDPDTGGWLVLLTNRVCPSRDNLLLMPLRREIHGAARDALVEK